MPEGQEIHAGAPVFCIRSIVFIAGEVFRRLML